MPAISSDARVATVLDPFTIVINKGWADGVRVGATFLIYAIGDDITDPVSREHLGSLEIVRGRAKATHVQERISTLYSIDIDESARKVIRKTPNAFQAITDRVEEVTEGASTPRMFLGGSARGFGEADLKTAALSFQRARAYV